MKNIKFGSWLYIFFSVAFLMLSIISLIMKNYNGALNDFVISTLEAVIVCYRLEKELI